MKRTTTAFLAGLAASALVAACGDDAQNAEGGSTSPAPTTDQTAAASSAAASSPAASTSPATNTEQTTLVTAPASERVDLVEPVFSNPTTITNPRFPISDLAQVIQLGEEAGTKVRNEVTLLAETRTVAWNGTQVETLVSQFTAYADGRLLEVAIDFFAQADDGSVWYFGEEVANYEDGLVANHDGTWLAGKDGPPGMIMPADPKVGDVYRPENIPDFVFEEVTVKAVDQTVDGPRGPVPGAVVVQELLMDGLTEDKTFAPGYGEFHFEVAADEEVVTLALAMPTDAVDGPVPEQLTSLLTAAHDVFESAPTQNWPAISASTGEMIAAWDSYAPSAPPPLLAAQMAEALDALGVAAKDQEPAAVRQSTLAIADACLDLQLQHRLPAEVELARMDRWARQVQVDVEADDAGAVAGDAAALIAIWDRVTHTVDPAAAAEIDSGLLGLRSAAEAEDLTAAMEASASLRTSIAAVA